MGKIVYNGREYLSAGTASTMQGATSTTDGVSGLVPQPLITDRDKVLKGDGTWGYASEVEANPSGTATSTLSKIDIDGVIYDIEGGGGSSGGMAAYTEVVLWHNDSGSLSPVNATLDDSLNNYDAIYVVQASEDTPTLRSSQIIPISSIDKSGNSYFGVYDTGGNSYYYSVLTYTDDTHLLLNSWGSNNKVKFYKVVGIKYGGNLSPIIYSTEEREVGVWIDNKPLYQITIVVNSTTKGSITVDVSNLNIADFVGYDGIWDRSDGNHTYWMRFGDYINSEINSRVSYDKDIKSIYIARYARNNETISKAKVTLYYTKTTDVAGSGSYNTLGVPMVHYDTSEQVIGTWIDGKTLYQRTWELSSVLSVASNTWVDTSILKQGIDAIIYINGANAEGAVFSFLGARAQTSTTNYVQIQQTRNSAITLKYITIQYTKTTD